MIPILYAASSITEGTVPTSYGIGALTDITDAKCSEERNGKYELTLTYPFNGIHADQIQYGSVIKAKPNFTDDPQLFRVVKIGKVMNGAFSIYCQHIAYDLSGKIITSGTASSCIAACTLLTAQAGGFTINTDKNVSADFEIKEPSSVRSWFGGKKGSLLDVYGTAEWHYDNFTATLMAHRGADRGVQIRYGKNLTQLSQEINMENLCTGIVPFCIDSDGNKTIGTKVATGLTLDFDRDRAVDFSQDVDFESATPLTTQLATLTNSYIQNNNFTNAFNSITLDFVQLSNLQERVDLCDTVHIFFDALGITAALKCVACTWDVLQERYAACTFGDMRNSIADTIATQQKQIDEKPTMSAMNLAIEQYTDRITGQYGGYVINGFDSNNDGYPDENLILDTMDINTATEVIRSNLGGIGFSSTGYAGPYTTAITGHGIVANAITTGVLNANLIKAGVIEDVNHNSQIDMTTGIAKLYQLIAKRDFTIVDENDVTKGYLSCASGDFALRFYDTTESYYVVRLEQLGNKGILYLRGDASRISLLNDNDVERAHLYINSDDGGDLRLYDENANRTIWLNGHTGHIKALKAFDKVYDGSLSAIDAWWTFTTDFAGLLIQGCASSGGSKLTQLIAVEQITTTATRFQLNDNNNWITFDVYINANNLIELKIANKNSSGAVEKVYGIF